MIQNNIRCVRVTRRSTIWSLTRRTMMSPDSAITISATEQVDLHSLANSVSTEHTGRGMRGDSFVTPVKDSLLVSAAEMTNKRTAQSSNVSKAFWLIANERNDPRHFRIHQLVEVSLRTETRRSRSIDMVELHPSVLMPLMKTH